MNTVDQERWQRVSALLEEISTLPRADRAPTLAAACANDSGLHEEVATLLGYDETDGSFDLLRAPGRVAAALWAQSSQEDAAPERIGPWQVLREIGRGGMGVVYLAQRADGQFDQRAALKLIRHDHGHLGLQRRFLRERQILARLEHPNIARLLDGGLDAQGHPYFAMEYVDGVPLFAHVSEYRCGLVARLQLFLKICAAVQFAHRQLVVHRDIKPSNVLVTRDGDLKLLDFGIATLAEERARSDETATHQQAFTPAYAAPEQLRGEVVTTAADVYALGAVLHELLSGRPAFGLAKNATLLDRLRALDDTAGALPSTAAALPPRPDIPLAVEPLPARALRGDLDVITSTALRPEPERRYPTVDALADDVRRFLEGRPITARAEDPRYRVGKFIARHRISVMVAGVLVLALLGALAVALIQADHAHDEALQARHQSERAEAVRTFITGVFEQSSPDANKGEPINPHQLLEKGETQLDAGISDEPSLQADAATLIADLYQEIGDYTRADALLKRALASSEDPRVPNDVKARVLVGIAEGEGVNGEYDAALAHARNGIAILQRDAHGAPEILAQAHEIMAHSLLGKGEVPNAIAILRSAVNEDAPALAEHDGVIADDWVTLGNALESEGNFSEAESAYMKGLELWRGLYGDDSVHVAHALNDLSVALIDKGDLAGAEDALRRSLAISERTLGPGNRDTLTVKNNLLAILEAEGHFDEAIAERIRLAASGESAGQLEPIDRLASHLILGVDYGEIGRFDDALGELDQALTVLDAMAGPHSPKHFSTLRHKGEVLMLMGRYADAEATLGDALSIQLKADPSAWLPVALAQLDLGILLHRQHRYADAVDLLTRAADALVAKAQKRAPGRSGALAALSEALLDSGDVAGARADAESSLADARQDFPAGNYHLGDSLYAMARVDLALGLGSEADALAHEAAHVRSPPFPPQDLRAVEVQVALQNALVLEHREKEAAALQKEIEERLSKSTSPYANDLLARVNDGHVIAGTSDSPGNKKSH